MKDDTMSDVGQPKDYGRLSLQKHCELKGKIGIYAKAPLQTIDDLSTFYTPGIAAVSRAIAQDKNLMWDYTMRGNSVAIISDGSAVLGLGNIGPEAAQPVMAGKALLFREFAGIDAYPVVLATQDTAEIIRTVQILAPTFGGINLEDISAPRCFEIEDALQDIGIPVMHDDQHGTAVVVLAGLINAVPLTGRDLSKCRIVLNGAGAAGTAIAEILLTYTQNKAEILMVDSKGIISPSRTDLNSAKREICAITNPRAISGGLVDALDHADIFIGVSVANALKPEMLSCMNPKPIIFALANPVPEIDPDAAKAAGAAIVATGRSDYPNQVNNVLAFPGIFRGALDVGALRITPGMRLAAAVALAQSITEPRLDHVLPNSLDRTVAHIVADAVGKAAIAEGVIRQR